MNTYNGIKVTFSSIDKEQNRVVILAFLDEGFELLDVFDNFSHVVYFFYIGINMKEKVSVVKKSHLQHIVNIQSFTMTMKDYL